MCPVRLISCQVVVYRAAVWSGYCPGKGQVCLLNEWRRIPFPKSSTNFLVSVMIIIIIIINRIFLERKSLRKRYRGY